MTFASAAKWNDSISLTDAGAEQIKVYSRKLGLFPYLQNCRISAASAEFCSQHKSLFCSTFPYFSARSLHLSLLQKFCKERNRKTFAWVARSSTFSAILYTVEWIYSNWVLKFFLIISKQFKKMIDKNCNWKKFTSRTGTYFLCKSTFCLKNQACTIY